MHGSEQAVFSRDSTSRQGLRPVLLGDVATAAEATFGTSGVRARVKSLTPELCWAYTSAFLSLLDRITPIMIGHDLRASSPNIAAVCHAAARHLGFETIHAGALPTPALAYASQSKGAAAIMVTGSHIPFDWNGLKFYRTTGEITKADEQEILAFPMPAMPERLNESLPEVDPECVALYLERYRRCFPEAMLSGMRIGVYEHSSVARDLLHRLLSDLGATTISLGRSDSFIAVDTEAVTVEDRRMGQLWASTHKLDAIVTTDGDSDRPLVADGNGAWLRGDLLGLICAYEIGASTVVTPITSTTALEDTDHFREVIRTRVGSPHVIAGMQQSRHEPVVGYEANGGFLLGSDVLIAGQRLAALRTRDAMLPILLVLRAACRIGGGVSALTRRFATRHSFSERIQNINLDFCRNLLRRLEADPAVAEKTMAFASGTLRSVDTTDGLRMTFEDGEIVHLRLSGNAPELRCYTEAAEAERAEELCRTSLLAIGKVISS